MTASPPYASWSASWHLSALVASGPVPEPTAEQIEAYDTGRAAYDSGGTSLDCPHPVYSELGVLWLRGYVNARSDDQYGPVR